MSSGLLPSGSLSLALSPHPSLHCLPSPLPGLYKCQDVRLPQAVSLAFFPPEQRDWWRVRKKTAGGAGERRVDQPLHSDMKKRSHFFYFIFFGTVHCHRQLMAIAIEHDAALVTMFEPEPTVM